MSPGKNTNFAGDGANLVGRASVDPSVLRDNHGAHELLLHGLEDIFNLTCPGLLTLNSKVRLHDLFADLPDLRFPLGLVRDTDRLGHLFLASVFHCLGKGLVHGIGHEGPLFFACELAKLVLQVDDRDDMGVGELEGA